MLNIEELANYINVDNIPNDWILHYDEAIETFNDNWLSDIEFNNIINFYEFDDSFKNKFKDLWVLVNNDINLNFLVYLWYYILYIVSPKKHNKWDFKLSYFKSHGSLYVPMVAMLMGYRIHEKVMLNYDEEQINIQKKTIRNTCESDFLVYKISEMRFSNMEWGSRFIRGEIVQIGILQYELKRKYLDDEDVIFIHIPRSSNFTKDNIDKSLDNKNKVFDYFNVSKNIKFVTYTWLLSPELEQILNSDSNIIYFQSKFDLIYTKENKKDFLKFIFKEPFDVDDYNTLEESNSLQKYIKNKLISKEKLHIGLGILK